MLPHQALNASMALTYLVVTSPAADACYCASSMCTLRHARSAGRSHVLSLVSWLKK